MGFRVAPAIATAAAACACGATAGLALELGRALFGSGPLVFGLASAAAAFAASLPPGRRRASLLPAAGGALLAWRLEDVARAAGLAFGPDQLVPAVGASLVATSILLLWPARDALADLRARHAPLLAAGAALGLLAGREPALLFILVNLGLTNRVSDPLRRRPGVPPPPWGAVPTVALLSGAALLGLAALRAPLDPSAGPWPALLSGAALGGLLSGRRLVLLAAIPAGVLAVALPLFRPEPAFPLPFALLGLAAGAAVAATGPRRGLGPGLLGGAALAALTLPLLPEPQAATSARTLLLPAETVRIGELRAKLRPLWRGAGAWQAGELSSRDDQLLVELDGSVVPAHLRASRAERFAGYLAGCLASGRTHARVGGDVFGLALASLRGQAFLTLDSATALPGLQRAISGASAVARRTWLHPGARLLPMPAGLLLRAGAPADAVVELLRVPWTTGDGALPDARAFASTRRSLRPGGVHVLLVDAGRWPAPALAGLAHDFASAWPHASLWLAPEGLDHLLLVGLAEAPAWAGLARCREADPDASRLFRFGTDLDLAAQAHLDGASLRALPAAPRPERPQPVEQERPTVLGWSDETVDPQAFFADAPEALRTRQVARRAILRFLDGQGEIDPEVRLDPAVAPWIDRAREALARARREGITSPAWGEADAAIATARRLGPENATVACLEGEIAVAEGHWPTAEAAYARCGELDPHEAAAWDGLALVRRTRGDLVGAEGALRKGVEHNPDRWQSQHNLGYLLVELGRTKEAEPLLRRAVAMAARTRDDPAPHLALAALHLREAPTAPDPERAAALALAEAERALSLAPSADAWYYHGAAHLALGHWEQAEKDFRSALEANPRHVGARDGLGRTQLHRRDYEGAAASFRAVLAADPRREGARVNLDRALERLSSPATRTPTAGGSEPAPTPAGG